MKTSEIRLAIMRIDRELGLFYDSHNAKLPAYGKSHLVEQRDSLMKLVKRLDKEGVEDASQGQNQL